MNSDPQTVMALLIVAVAASVLVQRGVAWWRGHSSGGCGGGCSGCGSTTTNSASRTKFPLTVIEPDSSKPTP